MSNALPLELQAARLRLLKERPYLAAAAWALHPVARPGIGTFAVDKYWRLYFDPNVTAKWTVEEITGVLYHEILHLLRDHATRMEVLDPLVSGIAVDMEVNDDLVKEKVTLPEGAILPEKFGLEAGLLAEEYVDLLSKQEQRPGSRQCPQPGDTEATGAGEKSCDESASQCGDARNSDASSHQRNSSCDGPRSSSVSKPGEGEDEAQATASSNGGDEAQLTASSDANPGGGGAETQAASSPDSQPAPTAGRCGSCATGQSEPWEDPAPSSGEGVSQAEAELIRREVARQITEHSRTRGKVPSHLERWASEKLTARVNWRRELATVVRRAISDVSGAVDYSYRRPSRRQSAVKDFILPTLRQPNTNVAVIVDTSGSVDDRMLSQALAEISSILKSSGQREGVTVLAVDAKVHSCKKVFRPNQIQLIGGGGTDMRVGIEAAERLKPRPDVIVVITDGETPWPDKPPRAKTVAVLVGDGEAPKWGKTIRIEE